MAALLFNSGPASRPRLCLFSDATLTVARTIEFCVPLSRSHPNRAKRSSVRCASVFVQVQTRRLAARQHGTTSLILRDLPLKERFTVVDTASIPTPTPLRNPIRARAEKCQLPFSSRFTQLGSLPDTPAGGGRMRRRGPLSACVYLATRISNLRMWATLDVCALCSRIRYVRYGT